MDARELRNPFRFDPWHLPLARTDEAAGAPSTAFRDFVAHPRRDAFWERRDLSRGGVAVPGLHWSGWYDVMLDGSLTGWEAATRSRGAATAARVAPAAARAVGEGAGPGHGKRPPAAVQQLVIAPTDHGLSPLEQRPRGAHRDRLRRLVVRSRGALLRPLAARGAQRCGTRPGGAGLRRGGRSLARRRLVAAARHSSSRASTCTVVEPQRSRPAAGSVARRRETRLPIASATIRPPRLPTGWDATCGTWRARSTIGGRSSLAPTCWSTRRRRLRSDLEVVGPLSATLYGSSSAPATDFTAALVDVFPDGYAQLVQEGVARVAGLSGGAGGRGAAAPTRHAASAPGDDGPVAASHRRPLRGRPPVRRRASRASRGLEQQLRALRPQPEHRGRAGHRGAVHRGSPDDLPRSPPAVPSDPAGCAGRVLTMRRAATTGLPQARMRRAAAPGLPPAREALDPVARREPRQATSRETPRATGVNVWL